MSDKQNFIIASCPIKDYADYFLAAYNEKGDNFLKVLKFNPILDLKSNNHFEEVSCTKVSEQITALGWSKVGITTEKEYMGLLMTGHQDGKLSLWSIVQLIESSNDNSNDKMNCGLIKSFKGIHSSKVTCIQYNIKPNIAATTSTELMIVQIVEENNGGHDLTVAMQCSNEHDKQEISSISWNDKVPYIISVASKSGIVYVWDMKKNKIHLKIRDQSMQDERYNLRTTVVWASDGVQIIIAYDDNDYPFLTQYHMSQTNAPYAEYHGGHNKSIYELVKNPNDPNFLLSVGRDNTVTCWSIRTQRNIYSNQFKEKIIQILWNPKFNDVILCVTESFNIEVIQVNFTSTPTILSDEQEELPKWMSKKSLTNFGWGGRYLTYNEGKSQISINVLSSENPLKNNLKDFISKIEQQDKSQFFENKIATLESKLMSQDSQSHCNIEKSKILMWVALKCIYQKDYTILFKYFGFDKDKLIEESNNNIGRIKEKKRTLLKDLNKDTSNNAFAFWEEIETKPDINNNQRGLTKETEREKPMTVKEEFNRNINWNQLGEKNIKSCLMFGELELAMENAFHCDRDAEALLIASSDPELFNKAKIKYFSKSKDLYIKNVFSSIINKNFNQLLEHNMKEWKEYLIYSLTYLETKDFKKFALNLGEKLFLTGDLYSSIVCDLLAGQGQKAIEKLYDNYQQQLESKLTSLEKECILITLFEQILCINYILEENLQNEITSRVLSDFCELLVNYRLYFEACIYLVKIKNPNQNILILLDRVYGHYEDKLIKNQKKPILPFREIILKANIEIAKKNFIKAELKQPVKFDPQSHIFNNFTNELQQEKITSHPVQTQIGLNKPNIIKPPIIKPPLSNLNNNSTISKELIKDEINNFNQNDFKNPPSNQNYPNSEQKFIQNTQFISKPIQQKQINNQISSINQVEPTKQLVNNTPVNKMDDEEIAIMQAFEKYQVLYNSVYSDSTRQKDFASKINSLFNKLKANELKVNLKKLLIQFIQGKIIFFLNLNNNSI